MTPTGSTHATFRRAVERGNLPMALVTARELGRLTLDDALALTALLARLGDARFEPAAVRWLGRLAVETQVALESLRLAVALVGSLPDERHGPAAFELLAALVRCAPRAEARAARRPGG
jgi:hypothetical protein